MSYFCHLLSSYYLATSCSLSYLSKHLLVILNLVSKLYFMEFVADCYSIVTFTAIAVTFLVFANLFVLLVSLDH